MSQPLPDTPNVGVRTPRYESLLDLLCCIFLCGDLEDVDMDQTRGFNRFSLPGG
jgi:hypothetical protein